MLYRNFDVNPYREDSRSIGNNLSCIDITACLSYFGKLLTYWLHVLVDRNTVWILWSGPRNPDRKMAGNKVNDKPWRIVIMTVREESHHVTNLTNNGVDEKQFVITSKNKKVKRLLKMNFPIKNKNYLLTWNKRLEAFPYKITSLLKMIYLEAD